MFDLEQDVIYVANDRFLCGRTECAGHTPAHSGRTADGHRLRELKASEVVLWYRIFNVSTEPLRCECGRLEAVLNDGIPEIRVV